MIYLSFIITFLVLLFVLLVNNNQNRQTNWWGALIIFYVISVIMFIIYLSKDLYYFSSYHKYFPLPTVIWNRLIQMQLSKGTLIRLLSLSCLLFIYSNVAFCLSFFGTNKKAMIRNIKVVMIPILMIQFVLYDPYIYKKLYDFLYPTYISASSINLIGSIFYKFTYTINLMIILSCIVLMFWNSIKSPNIKFMKYIMLALSINYTFLLGSYLFILSWAPTLLVKYSKVANFTRYLTVPLSSNTLIYAIFPYLLIVLFITGIYTMYKYIRTRAEFISKDIQISKSIDAGTITSRVFCHYIKNEILALSAEVEEIEISEENEKIINGILNRCENLYKRLNLIQKSTADATLHLKTHNIRDSIQNAIEHVGGTQKLKDIEVKTSFPSELVTVLIDKNYFEQVLINIIFNAAEAIIKSQKAIKKIFITVKQNNKWISISIKDTGIGIKQEDISRVFTPFYSTNPIRKNWGIGLSVSYKIITAHEGKISIKSQENIGTNIEILLPNPKI